MLRTMSTAKDLIHEVTTLLDKRRGDWPQIASDEAAGVSYSWLTKFATGRIKNPGYLKLRNLRDYLKPSKQAA